MHTPWRHGASADTTRNTAKWALGLVSFLALLALFASLQLFQLTSEGTGHRSLSRAVAVLTEIDALVARDADDLRQRAADARPGETVRLADFPVDVPLTPAEASSSSPEELRAILLDRAADRLYDSGAGELRHAGATSGPGAFSASGVVDRWMDFERDSVHDALAIATYALAAISAALLAALARVCRGYGRMVAAAIVVLAAALVLLVAGGAAWLLMQTGGSGYAERELTAIGEDLALVPLRNGLAFATFGLLLTLAGALLARWSDSDSPESVRASAT
ncbi:MAG: hypothetical protein WEC75_08355 [Dehalococcoidia bacterium]